MKPFNPGDKVVCFKQPVGVYRADKFVVGKVYDVMLYHSPSGHCIDGCNEMQQAAVISFREDNEPTHFINEDPMIKFFKLVSVKKRDHFPSWW